LAADLGVDEGDVDVLLAQHGEPAAWQSNNLASFLRSVLDPHGERTAPAGLYWPGADPEPRQRFRGDAAGVVDYLGLVVDDGELTGGR
jgi:hypothetical protein